MTLRFALLLISLGASISEASPLQFNKPVTHIVEYDGPIEHHAQNIQDIACIQGVPCFTYQLKDFSGPAFDDLQTSLKANPRSVVNFSFGLQPGDKPSLQGRMSPDEYQEALRQYEIEHAAFSSEIKNLRDLMSSSPQTFFSIAAGNGVRIVGIQSQGVALGQQFQIFPALIEEPNSIVVAALSEGRRDQIASYSNYGLTTVDLAAPVLANKKNEILKGTSYAAPYIARLVNSLQNLGPLSPTEIKEILLKSCEVLNIKAAIAATQDLQVNQESSRTFRAMYDRKRKVREALQAELGNILMVKSGGAINDHLALTCGQIYLESNKSKSITQSCLESHKQNKSQDLENLQELWKIRGF